MLDRERLLFFLVHVLRERDGLSNSIRVHICREMKRGKGMALPYAMKHVQHSHVMYIVLNNVTSNLVREIDLHPRS